MLFSGGLNLKKIIAVIIMVFVCSFCHAQAPQDVPKGHWAYGAVESLIDKGYVEGFPSGAFMGDRELTRYEFAVVIKRILDSLDKKAVLAGPEESNDSEAKTEIVKVSVSEDDVEKIKALCDEFQLELLVIGTRLDKIEADIAEIKTVQSQQAEEIDKQKKDMQTVKKNVDNVSKFKFSGYIQGRYAQTDDDEAIENEFSFRRIRLKGTFTPVSSTQIVLSADFAKASQGSSNPVELKDAYVKWSPSKGQFFELGQEAVPFGNVISQSTTDRETPERPMISQQLFKGERDRGLYYQNEMAENLKWVLGWFVGNGPNTTGDTGKPFGDVMARVAWTPENLEIGASYWYSNRAIVNGTTTENTKDRYGFDIKYILDPFTFKAEYMNGENIDGKYDDLSMLNERINGYYIQLAYSPFKKFSLIGNYERVSNMYFNLEGGGAGTGATSIWHLGASYDLNDYIKFRVFRDIYNGYKTVGDTEKWDNDKWIAECLVKF